MAYQIIVCNPLKENQLIGIWIGSVLLPQQLFEVVRTRCKDDLKKKILTFLKPVLRTATDHFVLSDLC